VLHYLRTMLKFFAAILLVGPLAACVTDATDSTDETESAISTASSAAKHCDSLPPIGEDQEYVFFNGQPYTMKFPGYFSPQSETFFIWQFGTAIQHDAPYPSSSHGRLYAIFAQGPAGAEHDVEGQPAYNHYHIITEGSGTRTLDVFLVNPGPNYNPATFDAPLSEHALNEAVVLAAPAPTTALGLGPLVIKVPVSKFDDHGHGHGPGH
jgi:hypothetical protein